MPRREPPLDAKLRQLGALQELTQKGQESAASTNLADIKGLADLYGISQQQQTTPAALAKSAAETEMLKAHTAYYTERPEEQKARGLSLKAEALHNMYQAGLPKEAIEAQAREMGLLPQATAAPMPQKGEYGAAGATGKPSDLGFVQRAVGASTGYGPKENYGYSTGGVTPPTPAGPPSLGAALTVNQPPGTPLPPTPDLTTLQKLRRQIPPYF